jgi:hypothetical protein
MEIEEGSLLHLKRDIMNIHESLGIDNILTLMNHIILSRMKEPKIIVSHCINYTIQQHDSKGKFRFTFEKKEQNRK